MSRYLYVVIGMALCALLLVPGAALAHEERVVGQYEFVVGFMNEPAFEGEQNGIWVSITDAASSQPVENLADTLKAQVIFNGQPRDFALEPAWNEPGVYTSNFYPTAAGDYTFRFFGDINGTAVDESFTSSPEGFNAVQAASALQFPVAVPSNAQLSTDLAAAQRTAQIALIVGGVGLVAGLGGLIVALRALRGRGSPQVQREATAVRS